MILVDVFVKTKCSTNKSGLEKKILDTSGLVQKTDYNAKITEIECKILSISGLATNSALTATVNKIPDVSSLVKKKTDYNTKISETEKKVIAHDHEKHITTSEFTNLTEIANWNCYKISTSRFSNKDWFRY